MVKTKEGLDLSELMKEIPDCTGEPWRLPDKKIEEMRVDRVLPGVNKNDDKQ